MAELKPAQKITYSFLEIVVICCYQSRDLLATALEPIHILDIANVEVVLEPDGPHRYLLRRKP
jgi:hypothetical protein